MKSSGARAWARTLARGGLSFWLDVNRNAGLGPDVDVLGVLLGYVDARLDHIDSVDDEERRCAAGRNARTSVRGRKDACPTTRSIFQTVGWMSCTVGTFGPSCARTLPSPAATACQAK